MDSRHPDTFKSCLFRCLGRKNQYPAYQPDDNEIIMRRFRPKQMVPRWLRRKLRRYFTVGSTHSAYLRESIQISDIGKPGALITEVFSQIREIPGWFSVDDACHFTLVLSYQSALGVEGDLLEIGSYHGRSTALMARFLHPKEKIVVCDAFEGETEDKYAYKPTPERLVKNIERVNPGLYANQIVVHKCLSNDLNLSPSDEYRFIHIDGGHSADQAYFDLKLCSRHLRVNGVIVMDDYDHPSWPGVTVGTDRFLRENDAFKVLADLNRHGAVGRKLYLIREG